MIISALLILCAVAVHPLKKKEMAVYECIVIVFMISLCCGSELHLATKDAKTLDGSQRGSLSVVQEQSCPTWYRETKYNGVTRCVCGATLDGAIECNYTTQETLISAGYCMSYNDTTKETVAGGCPFSNHHVGAQSFLCAQSFFVTLPNDTSELNSFMCTGLNRTGLLCSQCQKGLGPANLSYKS